MHASADARDRAFDRLYRRYARDVYRYTLALLSNPADAEDVTQTTFLNAYRAYKRGEEPVKPQNWLIKIAHNACRTRYLRASRRPREVPLEEGLRDLAVPPDEIPNVKAVLDALAQLPFNQRSALVMRELEGRSYVEIAQALDVTVPAVETLIFRARESLRVRRSALQTLAGLPLPTSLSAFSGGGAIVGGSALAGSGLALKAALAVGVAALAGTAGTAVESQVFASARPAATDAASPPSARAFTTSAARVGGKGRTLVTVTGVRRSHGASRQAELPRRGTPTAPGIGHVPAPVSGASPATGQSAPNSAQRASPVDSVTNAVREVVPAPAAPALPVQAPAPPLPATPPPPPVSLPVEPPALPPPPPLPPPPLP